MWALQVHLCDDVHIQHGVGSHATGSSQDIHIDAVRQRQEDRDQEGHGEWRGDRDRARGWCPNQKDYQRPGPSSELQAQVEEEKDWPESRPAATAFVPLPGRASAASECPRAVAVTRTHSTVEEKTPASQRCVSSEVVRMCV